MQRLEKERREMEKTIEGFRRSQAKLVELEKTNKKLQVSTVCPLALCVSMNVCKAAM